MGQGEETAKGALGGAATGATIGSVVPGVGTLIGGGAGAVIGGLAGYFGSSPDPREDQNNFLLPGYDERRRGVNGEISLAGLAKSPQAQAAQAGQFQNGSFGGQYRDGQNQLIGQLQAQANGQGPSLATAQFNRSLEQGVAAQQAQANTGRGNTALAARQAAQNIGGLTQGLAGQASQARQQEQLSARQQLAGVLGQARGQEIGASQFNAAQQNQRLLANANFQQDANLSNQSAFLQNSAQQNQYGLGLRDLELRNAQLQQAGQTAYATGQGPTLGDQILSGGTTALGYGFSSGAFK